MSKFYIANCTTQPARLYYRLDYRSDGTRDQRLQIRPRMQVIASGRQEALGNELHITQIEDVIGQLQIIGLRPVVEVPRMKGFIPFVFDIDKPVKRLLIKDVYDRNMGIRAMEGLDRRRRAAIGANQVLAMKIDMQPKLFEVGFDQEDETDNGLGRTLTEGYRVDPDAKPTSGPKGGRRGRAELGAQAA